MQIYKISPVIAYVVVEGNQKEWSAVSGKPLCILSYEKTRGRGGESNVSLKPNVDALSWLTPFKWDIS